MKRRKLLLIIIIFSVFAYGYSYLSVSKIDTTTSTEIELVNLKPLLIDKVLISTSNRSIQILKLKNNWIGTQNQMTINLLKENIDHFITNLSSLTSNQVIGSTKKKWSQYHVDSKSGIQVKIFSKSKLKEELFFSDLCTSDSSYLRLLNEQEVYKIPFCISKYFSDSTNFLRDNQILKFNSDQVTSLSWMNAQDLSINYFLEENNWKMKDEKVSKNKVDRFLSKISHLSSNNFADDFDEASIDDIFFGKLKIDGLTMKKPIEISCFYDKDRLRPYILKSNINQNTYFESDSVGIFSLLFKRDF